MKNPIKHWKNEIFRKSIAKANYERDVRNWPRAHKYYLAHLRRNPNDWAIWVQNGHSLKELGRLTEALDSYRRAIELAGDDDARLHYAFLLKRVGAYKESETEFRNLLKSRFSKQAESELSDIVNIRGFDILQPISDTLQIKIDRTTSKANTSPDVQLKIETLDAHRLRGWAVCRQDPGRELRVSVSIDGAHFSSLANTRRRNDLLKAGKSHGLGGFELSFPSGLLNRPTHRVEIKVMGSDAGVAVEVAGNAISHAASNYVDALPVAIVVPIYNAYDDVSECLDRLRQYTNHPAQLILINDASTDGRITEILREASAWPNVKVLSNAKNQGFTRTVNRGLRAAGNLDVVILNSDARVTPNWLEGLRRAAYSDVKIATATAMSDRAGVFSAPSISDLNVLPENVSEEAYAIAFNRHSDAMYPSVPTGNGFCMYIRRAALDELGLLDDHAFSRGYGEENDFCMRALRAGWRNVVDDATYVYHARSKSFGDEKAQLIERSKSIINERYPEYRKLIKVFRDGELLQLARFRALQARAAVVSGNVLPRALFVVSTETGGTPQTNIDLMRALGRRWECWLLHCDKHTITISRMIDGHLIVQDQYRLRESINPITFSSFDYDRWLTSWLGKNKFGLVHIRHMGWHSINLPRIAKKSGAAVVMSFHDFHVVCPTVKLIDNNATFCGGTCTPGSGICKPELWDEDAFPQLKHAWVYEWRKRYADALEPADVFVTTSDSARSTILKAVPEIAADRFTVIPHGRDFKGFCSLATPRSVGEPLRIVIPGNINQAKGLDVIEALAEQDIEGKLEFHILGKIQRQISGPNVWVHGAYKREDFAKKVRDICPHVGAIFSIWDETWCHTLTELWSVGVPAMAFEFPTVAHRIRSTGCGWVLDSSASTKETYDRILQYTESDALIAAKREAVASWQQFEGPNRSTAEMAERYETVYLQAMRRSVEAARAFS